MNDAVREARGGGPRRTTHSLRRREERFRLLVESVQDYAIFMLEVDGTVASWNNGAQRLKGWRADEIIGRSFTLFYTPEAVATGWPAEELVRAAESGRFEDEGWRVRKDGSRFWANVVITALRDQSGELRGFAKVTRDLTERRRQEEALRQNEEQFRLLVDAVKDYAVFMLDPDGNVLTWNAGAAAIKGYGPADVLGRHFSMFFTAEDVAAGKPARELDVALRSGRVQDEGWRVRKDGSVFWADVVITPMFDSHGELRGYAKVTRDLTETRRLVELEHSSRRMSEFLAMLAHELRNPLAPIRNALTIMQMQHGLSPPMQRTRDIVDRQVGHLTRLVDDLLDVGRIVTGKILLKSEPLNYREVVLASVEAVRPLIEAHRHELSVDLPAEPIEMVGDATRLVQALQNLLNNAARYTSDGGRIALTVRVDGTTSITTVTDTGRGISPQAIERIFELFVQEEVTRSTSESGLGIGLSLVRTLVELHGGMVSASSAGEGKGSTFTVRLPVRRAVAVGPATITAIAPQAAAEPGCRVLVVDDNRDSADTMVNVLELLGHEARAAYGGEQALRVVDQFHPQVVLLDLNMPGTDGFSVMRRLRERTPSMPVYIAAMTGYGQKTDRESTLAAGFQAHLTKPVDVEQLRRVMAAATRREG
jgi:PAS domain S-box-containing protein